MNELETISKRLLGIELLLGAVLTMLEQYVWEDAGMDACGARHIFDQMFGNPTENLDALIAEAKEIKSKYGGVEPA